MKKIILGILIFCCNSIKTQEDAKKYFIASGVLAAGSLTLFTLKTCYNVYTLKKSLKNYDN